MLNNYTKYVRDILEETCAKELPKVIELSQIILQRINDGGKCVIFGSGHGHILAEEVMGKPGNFDFIEACNPMDLYGNALKAGYVERNYEFAEAYRDLMQLKKGDILWLISNSGTNGVVVELAKHAKEIGVLLIAHTNMKQTVTVSARHPSGRKMYEYADYVIDNHGEDGDSGFPTVGDKKQGATSNCVGIFILQALNAMFASVLSQSNCTVEDVRKGSFINTSKIEQLEIEMERYKKYYFEVFENITQTQFENVTKAARMSSQSIIDGKKNYMFGLVHDHSLVEEIHSRSGTIMCNRSMVMANTDIQLYDGVKKAAIYANITKYGDAILKTVEAKQGDTFLCITQTSNEPAMRRFIELVKEQGAKVIVHTNRNAADYSSNNPIYREGDIVLDNCCAKEDAGLTIGDYQVGSISGSIGCFINQCYIIEMTRDLYEHGIDMPSRISINTDKGLIYTEELNRKYYNDTVA